MGEMDEAIDDREDEVADVARRAAIAASERRKQARHADESIRADQVDPEAMDRLGFALEKIEGASSECLGVMLFRGPDAAPLVSLLPEFDADETRRLLSRVASTASRQVDLLGDTTAGSYRNSLVSTERGAVLVERFGSDLLVVALTGSPPDVTPVWTALSAERAEIASAASKLIVDD
ncbi:MAG: hypothetical protein ACR2P0_03695 [Acidimicrobiales bacterium]